MKMMYKLLRRLSALLLALFLLPGAAAAWDYTDTIAGNMCVEVCTGNQWHELTEVMRYSHENGIVADGVLMFMPLERFLEQRELPSFACSGDFSYRVTCPAFVSSYRISWSVFRQSEEGLLPVAEALHALPELEPGVYLMRMQITAEGLSGSCSNECMFWLSIGAAEPASTFLPTPTPHPVR